MSATSTRRLRWAVLVSLSFSLAAFAAPPVDLDATAIPSAIQSSTTTPSATTSPGAHKTSVSNKASGAAAANDPANPYATLPSIQIRPVGGYSQTDPSAPVLPVPTHAKPARSRRSLLAPSKPSDDALFAPLAQTDDSAPASITVKPGVDQLIEIAAGQLNRIETPFGTPSIKTTSSADINVQEGVLYIAPKDNRPIVLYITETGQEDPVIALTLMPRRIPPRPVVLHFDDYLPQGSYSNPEAQKWETDQPYIVMLKNLMRDVAMGNIPPGYRLRRRSYHDPAVLCADPALRVDPQQILEGGRLIVTIGTIKNIAAQNIEIQESSCYLPGVVAVAAWPTPFLEPGQQSEIYVVTERFGEHTQSRHKRPSLINEYRAELP